MWTSSDLKENAKNGLRRYYWLAFAVCLIVTIFSYFLYNGYVKIQETFSDGIERIYGFSAYSNMDTRSLMQFLTGISPEQFLRIVMVLMGIIIASSVLAEIVQMIWKVFVLGPLNAGKNRFFVMSRGFDHISVDVLFSRFRKGKYVGTIAAIWAKSWRIWLWKWCFIIPGVIKYYEYSMVEYIIGENPDIEPRRALELSRQMTDGEKWNIFCLQMSFIGWFILGSLLCGVGILFVTPYYEATMAELYTVLRTKAFAVGATNQMELPGYDPAEQE